MAEQEEKVIAVFDYIYKGYTFTARKWALSGDNGVQSYYVEAGSRWLCNSDHEDSTIQIAAILNQRTEQTEYIAQLEADKAELVGYISAALDFINHVFEGEPKSTQRPLSRKLKALITKHKVSE